MKKLFIVVLLIVGLLIPAVSAEAFYDNTFSEFTDTSGHSVQNTVKSTRDSFYSLHATDITKLKNMYYITITAPYEIKNNEASPKPLTVGSHPFTATVSGRTFHGTYHYTKNTNILGEVTSSRVTYFFNEWDVNGLQGALDISFAPFINLQYGEFAPNPQGDSLLHVNGRYNYGWSAPANYEIYHTSGIVWENRLVVTEVPLDDYRIDIIRLINGDYSASTIKITDGNGDTTTESSLLDDQTFWLRKSDTNKIELTSPQTTYIIPLGTSGTQPPVVQPVLRTGTVTMTDNNGTTITGFEVTAVNAYTGEEYTVSTNTDVAVMTLPMDRATDIRNPQTGVYEEAPVGYYRFYGQAPGYKMLYEDGIQVTVMPEKYGSYQLCDIRVTQESGYLTGKHQFQIRSRSDNSILQSGTISAKSATTGEWYNTTVTDGIASLILPYDTSNVASQYAGNYYVYATSPGYEDNDYGTQIVVMPHTVSEIKSILLTPIGGVPTSGNVTLRIQAFSETGTGIPNAEIFVAGVLGEGASVWNTYIASSTGYLTVSVPGNSTYDIVASGTGYYDSARRVEVFDTDPALIEIKLYLSGAPTPPVVPTTQPTGWVTPTTPTQTTPPIQEDNLIGLSVKGLAKGFGIDYDTALLLFGLMIVFGAGGIVMNSVKGGAMEFIAGSIVGTFVAFALGLIPIWIFIIIAVVFGAYVLRVFLQGGQ